MQLTELYKLISYLIKSVFFVTIYLGLWSISRKKISNQIIRAVFVGIITPFCFYNFAINFIRPASYILYITGIIPDFHGILILIVDLTAKPVSIILGIIIALTLLVEDDFINELRK